MQRSIETIIKLFNSKIKQLNYFGKFPGFRGIHSEEKNIVLLDNCEVWLSDLLHYLKYEIVMDIN